MWKWTVSSGQSTGLELDRGNSTSEDKTTQTWELSQRPVLQNMPLIHGYVQAHGKVGGWRPDISFADAQVVPAALGLGEHLHTSVIVKNDEGAEIGRLNAEIKAGAAVAWLHSDKWHVNYNTGATETARVWALQYLENVAGDMGIQLDKRVVDNQEALGLSGAYQSMAHDEETIHVHAYELSIKDVSINKGVFVEQWKAILPIVISYS